MNQISDDLISRKAAYKAFSDYLNRNFIGEISSQTELSIGEIAIVIKSIPTAFDKEKVIEQIREKVSDCYLEYCGKYNNCLQCRADESIKIIEKGGIE